MKKVLLIEDDQTMSYLLSMLLKLEGFETLVMNKIESDFLEIVINEKPDCIVMDVHLKNKNGMELTKQIRGSSANKMKIVLSSGMDLGKECLLAGADAFLLKPYFPVDLINLIKEPNLEEK